VVNRRKYTTTVRCVSNEAHAYVINAQEFFNRFGKDEKTWKAILSLSVEKDSHTKKKIILAQKIDPNALAKQLLEAPQVSPRQQSSDRGAKKSVYDVSDMNPNPSYQQILKKHSMKATWDKFDDFRETMKEIVGSSGERTI
jgi:aconitase A